LAGPPTLSTARPGKHSAACQIMADVALANRPRASNASHHEEPLALPVAEPMPLVLAATTIIGCRNADAGGAPGMEIVMWFAPLDLLVA
jgi:hypothetical protein